MPINIEMPKLSDTMTEGTLLKWHKQVGDFIEIGDIIAEIETDKATMEMEAFDEGTLTSILIEAGGKAAIGSVLAVLDGQEGASAVVAEAVVVQTVVAAQSEMVVAAVSPTAISSGERIKASPLARKLASQKQVDLSQVVGTGPGGRIVSADVAAAAASSTSSSQVARDQSAAAAALAQASKARVQSEAPSINHAAVSAILPVAKEGDEIIALSSLRKIIASRLHTSKVTIPHFYLHVEVDAEPLMAIRKQINEQGSNQYKYSVNDFVMRALISAVQKVPAINASFAGDHIVRFGSVGLSVAIAIEDGLVTPVIKQAETKSLLQLSREVKDFAVRAKERKLRPDEFDGGTITISNLGAWGIESFDAIVNPPQAAILSVGAIIEKAVVKNGQVVPGLRMNLGLSADHRVVDGAIAASFLQEVKKLIEQPALMLV